MAGRRTAPRRKAASAAPQAEDTATETVEDAEPAKPTRRRAPRKAAKPAAEDKTIAANVAEDVKSEEAEPVIQPIVIEDSPPVARRRTGWWAR